MMLRVTLGALGALMLASCHHAMPGPAPGGSIGAGNPYPLTTYTCQDNTRLGVRLMGDRASVSVNGATAVDLPVTGSDGTTYSNGRQTLTIVQGSVSWAVGRAVPTPCQGG